MMRSAHAVAEAPVALAPPPAGEQKLLDINAALFRECFDKRPFLIGHRLNDHPLFALPRLIELSQKLPEKHVEYNGGKLPVSLDPNLTPRNGLSIEETIRRIEDCCSWMVLKYVEQDDDYRALLHHCLAEVGVHSELLRPGMELMQGFIFISSAGSVTPYHMDPEHNFLLQVRGSKTVSLFDGRDRSIVAETDLERFYGGSHRNMAFQEEWQRKAWVYDLQPGQGLHFPVTDPHHVKVGPTYSISFSITFRTPDLEKRSMVHNVNAYLRGKGLRPKPVGQSPLRDGLKCQAYRVWRRTRKLLGKTVE
ncbi:MAG TPA: cupin-like domain-containing protein [Gemmataceae bacterium]|nr:cupin-like domain-containing protein [Gemmataceae bacterium]